MIGIGPGRLPVPQGSLPGAGLSVGFPFLAGNIRRTVTEDGSSLSGKPSDEEKTCMGRALPTIRCPSLNM